MVRAFFEYGPLLGWAGLLFFFVWPLRLGRIASWALGLFLLFATQKFLIYKFFGGDSFVPNLPEPFIHLTGWLYSSSVLLFGLAGLWTFIYFCRWLYLKKKKQPPARQQLKKLRPLISSSLHAATAICRHLNPLAGIGAEVVSEETEKALDQYTRPQAIPPPFSLATTRSVLLICVLLAAALAGWGIWEGIRVPRVREVTASVKGWPRGFDGLRIVQLSDLHCSPAARRDRTRDIVAEVNALKPDLICITGDFLDGSPQERRDDLAPLKDLHAPLGVFGCAGNHEYYHDYAVWKPELETLGVRLLDNAHVVLARNGTRLVLGGVTDPAARRNDRHLMDGPNVVQAFAGSPTNVCRMLLQHRPVGLGANRAQNVRLQLSGHTHGGAVLGLDRYVKHHNQGHLRGFYQDGDLTLYVCPGTGQWAGFPVRLGVPAEITLLTVHPQGEEK